MKSDMKPILIFKGMAGRAALVTGLAAALITSPARAQGIPVFDAASVAQAIATVMQLEQEVSQQLQEYQSLTGIRGFGSLLSNPVVAGSLPANWASVYTAIQNGGSAGLTSAAQALRQASQIYNCEDQTGADQQLCQRRLNKPFQDKAYELNAYQTELQELNQIESLMQQIDTTQDPKGIAELQARLQSEEAVVNNDMTKLQLFKASSDSEDKLIEEQAQELALSRAANTGRAQDRMTAVTFGQ